MKNKFDRYRLEWITSFLAVVDFGGFAAAAAGTFRSQPQISAHVASLERHLGAVLFDRRERPVRLTEAGIAFLEHARGALASLAAGESSVQAVLGVLRGHVRLGWYPSAGAAFGPALLRDFARLYPDVSVTLIELPAAALSAALRDGEADVVLRPLLPHPSEEVFQHCALWDEPIVAIVPARHELATTAQASVLELSEYPIITIGDTRHDGDNQGEIDRIFAPAGRCPNIAFRTNQPQTLIE